EENGKLVSLDLLADGPVRTVVRAVRNLVDGLTVYTRTWAFYADRIEVTTDAKPSVTALHNRIYFTRGGTYADSRGKTALLDGKGDDEGIGGPAPEWAAVYSTARPGR
ncbi:MAG: hypothetical protein HYU66_17445, partial [Armatimonadetes bacterium]|nr:hypothetical protein [Armatimonadota bacterium]